MSRRLGWASEAQRKMEALPPRMSTSGRDYKTAQDLGK